MYTFIHVYINTCIHVFMYTCIHVFMYICMYAYMYVCICVYMYTCIHVYMYTCMHTYMHTCMYVYTHVSMCSLSLFKDWGASVSSKEDLIGNEWIRFFVLPSSSPSAPSSPAMLEESSTILPPPKAPPDTCSLVFTNTCGPISESVSQQPPARVITILPPFHSIPGPTTSFCKTSASGGQGLRFEV